MARAISNREPPLAGTMDEMSGRAQVTRQLRILPDRFKGARCSTIAILPDQRINGGILPELTNPGGEDNQFGIIRQRHASAIDALVSQPCAFELVGIEENHSLLDLPIHHLEVDLETEICGEFEALRIVTNIEAANDQLPVDVLGYDRQHINDRHPASEVFASIVEYTTNRRIGAAHHAFHSIHRAKEVAAMNSDGATRAYEDVLVVVRHADDFMGNDLAYGEDEIVATVAQ